MKVNGRKVPLEISKGFARVERQWTRGDTIVLDLPMPIRRVIAHEAIEADRGRVALQRGPLVYCLEWPDNEARVQSIIIPDDAKLKAKHQPDLLNGVTVITGKAQIAKRKADASVVAGGRERFTAIPYYAWAHRGRGPMLVWPARTIDVADPGPAETLAYTSKLTASFVHASLEAIKDQVLPLNSGDNSKGQLDFWPHNGTTEWLQFAWDRPQELSRVKVYWFDDSGHGGCKLPKSWEALYQDASGDFKPVENSGPYGIEKDGFNTVEFIPVETKALKIEIVLNEKWSAGIQEVEIE